MARFGDLPYTFRSHSRVSDPRVTKIELPPSTTAIYQPLNAGAIAVLKGRHTTRLLQRVVARVVSVWFGLQNMNGIQPDSLERWSVRVEPNNVNSVPGTRGTQYATFHSTLRCAAAVAEFAVRVRTRQPSPGSDVGVRLLPPASQMRPFCAPSPQSAAVSTLRLATPAFRAPRGPERGIFQSQCTAANNKANFTEVAPMKLLNIMARKSKYSQVVYRLVFVHLLKST